MTAYIVRHREKHTCLGLFVARSVEELWDTVDELTDPYNYEWTRISSGAIYFPKEEPSWCQDSDEVTEDGCAADENPFLVEPSEMFMYRVWRAKKWTPFDAADVGVGIIARAIEAVQAKRAAAE